MQGFGSWIYFKNLPLDLGGSKYTFEAIGAYFMGLESNASETLNLINCTEAIIQVRRNLCGFMPSTIEIEDSAQGNFLLHLGDIEVSKPPGLFLKKDGNNTFH